MERPFDFTDERKWNVDRLIERLASLGDHKKKISSQKLAAPK